MTKAELIAEWDALYAHYKTLTEYNEQEPVFKKLGLMNLKIKMFPTIKLVNQLGEIVNVFARPADADAYLSERYNKIYWGTLKSYPEKEGFRRSSKFIENWNTYSDHSLSLEPLGEDVPENLVQMAWDYYGCL